MPIPAVPAAYLILVQPDLALGGFEAFFNRPAGSGHPNHVLQGAALGHIGHVVSDVFWIGDATTDEWLALCEDLDIPATRLYSLDELPEHPHLQAVGLFQETQHPTEGAIREIRPTTRFHATPTSIRRPAPALGQHTREVLLEAGLTEDEIRRLSPVA